MESTNTTSTLLDERAEVETPATQLVYDPELEQLMRRHEAPVKQPTPQVSPAVRARQEPYGCD